MKRKKIIHLIHYSVLDEEHQLYIGNFSFTDFYKCCSYVEDILVLQFAGYAFEKSYGIDDASSIRKLFELFNFIQSQKGLFLNLLMIRILDNQCEIVFDDDSECTISTKSKKVWEDQGKRILDCFGLGKFQNTIKVNPGKYFAIDESLVIVGQFEDFDEYLNSGFIMDPDTYEII